MTIQNGQIANAVEVLSRLPESFNTLRMILDLDSNGIYTFTRANYDNLSWDIFDSDTYYDSGDSSQVLLNVTAGLVALAIDNTNQVYAADFTAYGYHWGEI